MSKGNKIALFCTGLVGILSLSACAPAVVTAKQAHDTLDNLIETYDNGLIKKGNFYHTFSTEEKIIKSATEDISKTLYVEEALDLDNLIFYRSLELKKGTKYKYWSYFDNNYFFEAIETKNTKMYNKTPTIVDHVRDGLDDNPVIQQILFPYNQQGLIYTKEVITALEQIEVSDYTNSFGNKITLTKDYEYRSDLETNLHFYTELTLHNASQDSYFTNATIVETRTLKIEDFELQTYGRTQEINGTKFNKDYYSYYSFEGINDREFDLEMPLISEFIEGDFKLPQIDF